MSSSHSSKRRTGDSKELHKAPSSSGGQSSKSPDGDSFDGADGNEQAGGGLPRPKRIACIICRKRKLKCDGNKPSCGTCTRLNHDCGYDEVRRKSGPKRGYVKALEARLAQVETLLKTQEPQSMEEDMPNAPAIEPIITNGVSDSSTFISTNEGINFAIGDRDPLGVFDPNQAFADMEDLPEVPDMLSWNAEIGIDPTSWEMIGLGIDEPLPAQHIIDDLEDIYFNKIHMSLPLLHRKRYYAALNLAPLMRPPICLRYIIWALAATSDARYNHLGETFYRRSRKYLMANEMASSGEQMVTLAQCQTWSLVASYEFKLMYFPRAWTSSGQATRMSQMMGLYRLDGAGLDVKQCLPPPRDWTEREERRRAFWMAFCQDRYASVGTGWPMVMDERDIMTHLPSSEEAYENCRSEETMSLESAMRPAGARNASQFGALVLMAAFFGRNLHHLHRTSEDDSDEDVNGQFWKRHREMDNAILNFSLSLPENLRLGYGGANAHVVFINMTIHTATICLHQAAIYKSDKNRLPGSISAESKIRCITAASEIATIMRTISHLDLSSMNPFTAFCLYVSARVFVQYLKTRPEDNNARSSLRFLLTAMQALKSTNPLVESFLIQLEVDLEGVGITGLTSGNRVPPGMVQVGNKYPLGTSAGRTSSAEGGVDDCVPWLSFGEDQGARLAEERRKESMSGTATSSRHSSIQDAAVATASPDSVPPPGFPQENSAQRNLPNRLKSNYNPKHNSPRTDFPLQSSVFGQGSISTFVNMTSSTQATTRKQDPPSKSFAGFVSDTVPGTEMSLSPDNSGSTPDTTGSTHNSSHTSYTPSPREDNLGYDANRLGAGPSSVFPNSMWTPYSMDTPTMGRTAGKNPGKNVEVESFEPPQEWDAGMPTGMTPEGGFGNMMEGHNWDEIMAQGQQEEDYTKQMQ